MTTALFTYGIKTFPAICDRYWSCLDVFIFNTIGTGIEND
jgi:hypothetical protein